MLMVSTSRARWGSEHWQFLALTVLPALLIAVGRVHGLPTAAFLARYLSLMNSPRALQHTLGDILLVPIGALTVVVFRLTLGIHVLGPFRSILLAFAFLTTGVALGLGFLAATVLILVLARPAVKKLRLPYFGRVSVMISAVALVMIVGTLASGWLQSPSLRNVAHFPIVVLVLVGEKVALTIRREGPVTGIWRASTTALVGVAVTGIASIPGLSAFLLARPELLLVEIALIAVVSMLCNWRLLESLNPRPSRAPQREVPSLASRIPDLVPRA
jgi:7 transmembrane helices usually fused to an inactive transglutaminase